MVERIPMIAGNWKMNLTLDESINLVKALGKGIRNITGVDVLVAPPFTVLAEVKKAIDDSGILLGAQNMHWESNGAYTGEISGAMLKEAGCSHVILGHSERRSHFQEPSQWIDLKTKTALSVGLTPIVCVGETIEEREKGQAFQVIEEQLTGSLRHLLEKKHMPASAILAYEPVWAIGTGHTATPDQAQEVHQFIRKWMTDKFGSETADRVRILYGGSVKPDNVNDLMSREDIDGALVGGASLKADSFLGIVRFQE
jgi:triosephosphate isomerase